MTQSEDTLPVGALEWERGIVHWARPMPGMRYVSCSNERDETWSWWLDEAKTHEVCADEKAAKAAAQADYARRILSALTPSATAPSAASDAPPPRGR